MALLDTILEGRSYQTEAERLAYIKVRDDLSASGLPDMDELEYQAMMANTRLTSSKNITFPLTIRNKKHTKRETIHSCDKHNNDTAAARSSSVALRMLVLVRIPAARSGER